MECRTFTAPANMYGIRVPGWTNHTNNMPAANVTSWESIHVYILDDVDPGQDVQGIGDPRAIQHARCNNDFYDVFSHVVDGLNIHRVRMQAGQRSKDFKQYIATELAKYSSRDLVMFYFHGKAGEKGDRYTWKFRGPGPKRINANDFICQVNDSEPDCYLILDCFVATHIGKLWKRTKHMTEFSIRGDPMRNSQGQLINGPDDFTETLCRALRDIKRNPSDESRLSLHHIIAKDNDHGSKPIHIFTAKPDRRNDVDVWRFQFDIDRLRKTGSLQLRKCLVTGSRPGDGRLPDVGGGGENNGDNDEDEGGDNGGDNGGEDGGDDGNDGGNEDGEDDDGSENGDAGGDQGVGKRNVEHDDRRKMGDETTNDDQDDGNDKDDTDALRKQVEQLRKQLRTTSDETFRNNPELKKHVLALSSSLQPARQQVTQASKRPRLFGQNLPSVGPRGAYTVELSDQDDEESIFMPRTGAQRPTAKRAKRLAATANSDTSRSPNIVDLDDADDGMKDANSPSLIERLVTQNNNNVSWRHSRATSHVSSRTPKEEQEDDFKKSPSHFFDPKAVSSFSSSNPVKREPSGSSECEITGSRRLRTFIDLSTDGELVDVTQEDWLEE